MIKEPQQAKKWRVDELYGNLARHRIQLKDVCAEAGLNTDSVYSNLREYRVSFERIEALEEAFHRLVDKIQHNSTERKVV